MKVGSKGRYAVSILLEMAVRGYEEPVPVRELADRTRMSMSYIEQILSCLKSKGLVRAMRGPGGGYRLGRVPADISVAEVIAAAEGEQKVTPPAAEDGESEVPMIWKDLSSQIYDFLDNMKLADFTKGQRLKVLSSIQDEKSKRLNFVLPRPVAVEAYEHA